MKGALFTPDNIRATAEKRKTQTRRLDGLKEINQEPDKWMSTGVKYDSGKIEFYSIQQSDTLDFALIKPRYKIGEKAYIKEAHYRYGTWVKNGFSKSGRQKWTFEAMSATPVKYYDDPPEYEGKSLVLPNTKRETIGWYLRSPLFLPANLARYFIKITGLLPQRLQDITEGDIIAEGIETGLTKIGYYYAFGQLWNSINKTYPYESNPWVWAYKYELVNRQQYK